MLLPRSGPGREWDVYDEVDHFRVPHPATGLVRYWKVASRQHKWQRGSNIAGLLKLRRREDEWTATILRLIARKSAGRKLSTIPREQQH